MQRRILSLVFIILVLGAYYFLNSSLFFIDELEWTGLTFISEAELLEQVDFSSNNVFRIDQSALANQISNHLWIKFADISWGWPNRLVVSVVEREAIGMIPSQDSWFLLDTDGDLLPPPRGFSFGSLPLITNIDSDNTDLFITIARLLTRLPANVYEDISELNAEEQILITRSGTQILLGDLRDLNRKLETLELVLADLSRRNINAKRIDLRILNSPVIIE